jgi:uncharacterized protein
MERKGAPMQEPLPLGKYRHYKGGNYEVVGTARHSETDEQLVVYRCLYDNDSLWVRPLAMFVETVLVDGREVPRFERYKSVIRGE